MSPAARAGRALPLTVLVVAVAALLGSLLWSATVADRDGWGGWDGSTEWDGWDSDLPGRGGFGPHHGWSGMPALRLDEPVDDIEDAARAAQRFAEQRRLTVGEVMEFRNGYYAELRDGTRRATEVIVDPARRVVHLEYGPAMMWNTEYGRHRRGSSEVRVSPEQARAEADRWLAARRPGVVAGEAEAFPGYYTLHTMRGSAIEGMLSVHARTGAVWYHDWHGAYVRTREPAPVPR